MTDHKVKSVLFAGVGGQGILRASDIMCEAMMEAGTFVKVKSMGWHNVAAVSRVMSDMVKKSIRHWQRPEVSTRCFLLKRWRHLDI